MNVNRLNAAGIIVSGNNNPNWKGGKLEKTCFICGKQYAVRPGYVESRYCSMKCVGISQRGTQKGDSTKVLKLCPICNNQFHVYKSHNNRIKCCSKDCSFKMRAINTTNENNPNWVGGISRLPYAHNWASISKSIIKRDGKKCMNERCVTPDAKLCVHHIDYEKQNNNPGNLITVCIVCNSKANFNRDKWKKYYSDFISKQLIKGEWIEREF